jgi:hypothetical protein
MTRLPLLWLVPALLSLSGCAGVVSLHPLAVPNGKDTVFDPALLGTWEDVTGDAGKVRTRYVVERAESGYKVTAQEGNEKHEGTMHLMKVGGRYLLDVFCPSEGAGPSVHLFLRLRLDKDAAWLAEMNTPWLKDQIESRGQPRHETLEEGGDKLLLTASTAELIRYLLPLAGDDRSFDTEAELRRIR